MQKDLCWVNPHVLKGYSFNWEKAFKYAKLMEKGEKFPPVQVILKLSGDLVIKNGMHRTIAAKLCGHDVLVEIVFKEKSSDEYWEDMEANFRVR